MLVVCHAPQAAPLGHIESHRRPYQNFQFPVVNLDMCLSVNIKLINTHPRVPIPYLWDRPSRKKNDLVLMGGLSQRTKITLCRCQKIEIPERK